ncbi:MAG: hypothetical protein AABZ06_05365 [Bdellovibrionota bacterium]
MVKIILFLAMICATQSFALADEKIVLRAEKSSAKIALQRSLVYDKDKVILGLNSNELCGPETEVSLGLFERKQDAIQKNHYDLLKQISNRMKPRTSKSVDGVTVNGTRYFLGNNEISDRESLAGTAQRLFSESCAKHGWIAKRVMLVDIVQLKGQAFLRQRQLIDDKQVSIAITPLARANCDDVGKTANQNSVFDCTIDNYGLARLIAGKN